MKKLTAIVIAAVGIAAFIYVKVSSGTAFANILQHLLAVLVAAIILSLLTLPALQKKRSLIRIFAYWVGFTGIAGALIFHYLLATPQYKARASDSAPLEFKIPKLSKLETFGLKEKFSKFLLPDPNRLLKEYKERGEEEEKLMQSSQELTSLINSNSPLEPGTYTAALEKTIALRTDVMRVIQKKYDLLLKIREVLHYSDPNARENFISQLNPVDKYDLSDEGLASIRDSAHAINTALDEMAKTLNFIKDNIHIEDEKPVFYEFDGLLRHRDSLRKALDDVNTILKQRQQAITEQTT